jgi:hypothetical protein
MPKWCDNLVERNANFNAIEEKRYVPFCLQSLIDRWDCYKCKRQATPRSGLSQVVARVVTLLMVKAQN